MPAGLISQPVFDINRKTAMRPIANNGPVSRRLSFSTLPPGCVGARADAARMNRNAAQ